VNGIFAQLLEAQDYGDMAPTPSSLAAIAAACKDLATVSAAAQRLTKTDLPVLDAALGRHSLTDVPAPERPTAGSGC